MKLTEEKWFRILDYNESGDCNFFQMHSLGSSVIRDDKRTTIRTLISSMLLLYTNDAVKDSSCRHGRLIEPFNQLNAVLSWV